MKQIWKFPLKVTDLQNVQLPDGAEILSIQTQFEQPCIWALVDPVAEKVSRTIWIIGTGHPIEQTDRLGTFIGTFQFAGGGLVFHAFEAKR